MANMTLAIPDKLYKQMKEHKELKWSEVARKAFEEKMDALELADDLESIRIAKKEHRKGKTISEQNLAKKLGIKI